MVLTCDTFVHGKSVFGCEDNDCFRHEHIRMAPEMNRCRAFDALKCSCRMCRNVGNLLSSKRFFSRPSERRCGALVGNGTGNGHEKERKKQNYVIITIVIKWIEKISSATESEGNRCFFLLLSCLVLLVLLSPLASRRLFHLHFSLI